MKTKTKTFFKDFKDFAIKGNVIDLAIGVVIGTAFKAIVDSVVNDIIMPIVGLGTGNVDFSELYINLSKTHYTNLADAEANGANVIRYGVLVNAIINFIIIALIIFIVVKYIINQKDKEVKAEKKETKTCPFCFETIHKDATRCKFCTAKLEA